MRDSNGRIVGIHASEESALMQRDLFLRIDLDDNYLAHEVVYTVRPSRKGMYVLTKWVERFTCPDAWSQIIKELDDDVQIQ